MKAIKPIKTQPCMGGTQKLFKFANGYGASVIRHEFTYGGTNGRWELAVLSGKSQVIDYSTPITSDVLGWLTWPEVQKTLRKIKALKRNKNK
jgi:hypothetical protein